MASLGDAQFNLNIHSKLYESERVEMKKKKKEKKGRKWKKGKINPKNIPKLPNLKMDTPYSESRST